ncbi:MAG: hypothetical protein ABI433_03520 [Burkholderiaceae bacterium]
MKPLQVRDPQSRGNPRLRFRPTRRGDLGECIALLPAWLGPQVFPPADMAALWSRLLDEPSITSTVVEDLSQPVGQRIQGWGTGLVLPPEWVIQLGLSASPLRPAAPVVPRLYAALLAGRLPLLGDRALGEINARGQLHFMNLHYTQRHADLGDDRALAVLSVANEAFRAAAAGYWMQAMHFESSVRDAPMFSSAGFPQVPYAEASTQTMLPDDQRLVFFGIGRDEARASLPGTSVRHAFEHSPPRYRLSATQRRLLWRAMFDESDEEVMQTLGVSAHGLKKLWRGIYERIADVEPEFFGDEPGDDAGKRGPEKRRQVLAYVRQRPEELRPWFVG